ncbi:MAG: hypothetical protein ABI743_03125 [bacterium]
MAARKEKRSLYLVQEDLSYFRQLFRPDDTGAPPRVGEELLEEFIQYSNYVEENYQYNFVFKAFPKVFMTRLLRSEED